MYKKLGFGSLMLYILLFCAVNVFGQSHYKPIPLPQNISSRAEEYSGMTQYNGRVYLLPQYGDRKTPVKKDNLKGEFLIYSLRQDSIDRVIAGKDTALTAYKTFKVTNLDKLPDNIGNEYEGFEAISIVNNMVYLSIETDDKYANCYLLKAKLDTINAQIAVDPVHIMALKRPELIYNAGFEAVSWLPKEHKLLAYYEYNGMPDGGTGYLIDTSFTKQPEAIKTPQLYFRITDIAINGTDKIYGINYFWNGDYPYYLGNPKLNNQEANIKKVIPALRDSLNNNAAYLKTPPATFARIVMLKNHNTKKWKQVATFPGYKNNWEGIVLHRKGALVITDANGKNYQETVLAYVEF